MALGYDGKLYILAFDHRGSFQKKMFGIQGDPTPEETETIADAKRLIFEGMELAVQRGVDAARDRRAGRRAVRLRHPEARQGGATSSLAMPVEKSGQDEFDFQYGADFGEHIARYDVDFAKVLVRYNPDGDAEMNERQLGRLKELADWLHANDGKFLFELLVPAEAAQLESVGGDTDRYDAELRPKLMKQAIQDIQDFGIEVDVWKIEGVDAREDAEALAAAGPHRRGPRGRRLRAARPRRVRRQGRPLAAPGRAGRGLRRLRDRPLDLVGRAQGLPRRRASTAPPRPRRSPTTTCASSRSTTTRSPARASDARAGDGGRAARGRRPRAAAARTATPRARATLAGRVVRVVRRRHDPRPAGLGPRGARALHRRSTRRRPAKPGAPASASRDRAAAFNARLVGRPRGAARSATPRSATATGACSPTSTPATMFVNEELVRGGYAAAARRCRPNVRYADALPRLAREARRAGTGPLGILRVIR